MTTVNETLRGIAQEHPWALSILGHVDEAYEVREGILSVDDLQKLWCGEIQYKKEGVAKKKWFIRIFLVTKARRVIEITNEELKTKPWRPWHWLFRRTESRDWYQYLGETLLLDTYSSIQIEKVIVFDHGPKHYSEPRLTFYSLPEGRTMREFLNEYFEANRQKIPESGMAGVKDDKPSGAHGSGLLA